MAQTNTQKKDMNQAESPQTSWGAVIARFNNIYGQFAELPYESIFRAFGRAWANMPSVQNSRIKALNPLPCDYTKEELNDFLTNPQNSEFELQQIAEGLRWSNYSFQKLAKSYADVLEYHSIVLPQYVTDEEFDSDAFMREYRLVEKFVKCMSLKAIGQQVTMQSLLQGKVFYALRYSVDKSHNTVNYFALQELPKQWCTIIGKNSISKWTVSFNLMYFMQPGTDFRQFGDLFEPYMQVFDSWYADPKPIEGRFVYMSDRSEAWNIKAYQQNGRWFYYVSLPIDRVWTFEIDPSTGIVASPLSGLMQTFAQQSDYEAAQLSVVLNPLIKIFTGEIPYKKNDNATVMDAYEMSNDGRDMFVAIFDMLMRRTNTAGVGLYAAPFENIKSHDFQAASNANEISRSYLSYGMAKSGAQGIIPIDDRPTEEAVKASEKLEPKYAQEVYRTFERMLTYVINKQLGLKWEWRFNVFGDIFSDEVVRTYALKLIDKGDLYGWIILSALDGISIMDRVCANKFVKSTKFMETLQIPPTAYTQSGKAQPKSDTGGAPTKTESDRIESKIEKQTQGATEDGGDE